MVVTENDLIPRGFDPDAVIEKQNKIERFLKYSKEQGTLCGEHDQNEVRSVQQAKTSV